MSTCGCRFSAPTGEGYVVVVVAADDRFGGADRGQGDDRMLDVIGQMAVELDVVSAVVEQVGDIAHCLRRWSASVPRLKSWSASQS